MFLQLETALGSVRVLSPPRVAWIARRTFLLIAVILTAGLLSATDAAAQINSATTSLTISICGDSIVNAGEQCDVPGDTGLYSTTIAGRQCTTVCRWAPYCGDGVLQTVFNEECDDGNNTSNDFCSADCKDERADSGGGSQGGGGSSGSGGRDTPLGDTRVSIQGRSYPNSTVTILRDGEVVSTVRANSRGEFLLNVESEPGAATFSFWANDAAGTRSATYSTTFDVTQGAVTTATGILIPPTLRATPTTINPGETITLSGQTVPNVTVEVQIGQNVRTLTATADATGAWQIVFPTAGLAPQTYPARARFIDRTGLLSVTSNYGTAVQLFVGVEGRAASNADLNRDGRVNLTDFSILIFWWGTNGGNSNPPADINGNSRVSLEDFSILLFNWTG
jgi:cysteine-rich repeat protein